MSRSLVSAALLEYPAISGSALLVSRCEGEVDVAVRRSCPQWMCGRYSMSMLLVYPRRFVALEVIDHHSMRSLCAIPSFSGKRVLQVIGSEHASRADRSTLRLVASDLRLAHG
jgi:acyl-coenzyme A synthetase/AMP-(fatty) acid ligase